jgi:hypothetical protein
MTAWGCTKEKLYALLEELGDDTSELHRHNMTFATLENRYYKLLDSKLREIQGK